MRFFSAIALGWLALSPAFAASFEERLATCLACHGAKGQSETADTPSLGGQPENFLLTQLFTFREKIRKSELMNELAKEFTDDDLRMFSAALAKLPAPPPSTAPAEPERMARAQVLVVQARCNVCHQANFAGQDQVPRISAQREDYLLKSLRGYKSGERLGYDPAMGEVMRGLSDDNIVDLAHFLSRTK
jgi:cytochrome c553